MTDETPRLIPVQMSRAEVWTARAAIRGVILDTEAPAALKLLKGSEAALSLALKADDNRIVARNMANLQAEEAADRGVNAADLERAADRG